MKTEVKNVDVQGAEDVTKEVSTVTEKRSASASGTVKGLQTNIRNAISLKMVTDEEAEQLKKLHKTIVERWMGLSL